MTAQRNSVPRKPMCGVNQSESIIAEVTERTATPYLHIQEGLDHGR
jgi:hypothetical protein